MTAREAFRMFRSWPADDRRRLIPPRADTGDYSVIDQDTRDDPWALTALALVHLMDGLDRATDGGDLRRILALAVRLWSAGEINATEATEAAEHCFLLLRHHNVTETQN